mgnify:FL=1
MFLFLFSDNQTQALTKCSICHRHFLDTRLTEHQRACQQKSSSSQYHYNSQLHRWKGLDYEIKFPLSTNNKLANSKLTWREQHEQFRHLVKGESFARENNLMMKHPKACTDKRKMNK